MLYIKKLHTDYPKLWKVKTLNSSMGSSLIICKSPLANCQLFSIGAALMLRLLRKSDLNDLMYWIKLNIYKQCLIIDIKDHIVESTLKTLKPYTEEILSKSKYISSNGSTMYNIIIQLDMEKLPTRYINEPEILQS